MRSFVTDNIITKFLPYSDRKISLKICQYLMKLRLTKIVPILDHPVYLFEYWSVTTRVAYLLLDLRWRHNLRLLVNKTLFLKFRRIFEFSHETGSCSWMIRVFFVLCGKKCYYWLSSWSNNRNLIIGNVSMATRSKQTRLYRKSLFINRSRPGVQSYFHCKLICEILGTTVSCYSSHTSQ